MANDEKMKENLEKVSAVLKAIEEKISLDEHCRGFIAGLLYRTTTEKKEN